jgi:hypothetical protein
MIGFCQLTARVRVGVKVLRQTIEFAATKAQNLPPQVECPIGEGRFRAFVGAVSTARSLIAEKSDAHSASDA